MHTYLRELLPEVRWHMTLPAGNRTAFKSACAIPSHMLTAAAVVIGDGRHLHNDEEC